MQIKTDNKAMDIVLGELLKLPLAIPDIHLKREVMDAGYSQMDYERIIPHLLELKYIIPNFQYSETNPGEKTSEIYGYVITAQGKKHYLSGGFSPNAWQRLKRFSKSDSGYGNTKWIITVMFTLLSIALSVLAFLKK